MDLGSHTVYAGGLIDCHIHFAHWGMNLIAYQGQSLMLLAAETVAALHHHARGRLHDRPGPRRARRRLP